jgi:penicillin G amidase
MKLRCLLLLALPLAAEDVILPGLGLMKSAEILRDKWGVPHIYAASQNDLFFTQGYMAARDRLFQIDLWRRIGTGRLSEVLGPQALNRDRVARLVRYRGDWNAEWSSYSPDARDIAVSFTNGINAYIKSLNGRRPLEFRIAGYDPALWEAEDVVARIAGLLMTRNLAREVRRAEDITRFGIDAVQRYMPPDPFVKFEIPNGLDLAGITSRILAGYTEAIGGVTWPDREAAAAPPGEATSAGLLASSARFDDDSGEQQGSNNWVVTGSRSVTGKPLLASDPHRPVQIPSLRKTVHLNAPGWNAIGAGEPALPGIALGHNEDIGYGFTIVGIDQGDLYVEKLNPADPGEYEYKGSWRKMTVIRDDVSVLGSKTPRTLELRYTIHGPVIAEDLGNHRAYALKWVGSEPGTAGYFAALSLSRAKNWDDFVRTAERYKVPSENMIYADRAGNIGWIATGMTPIRKNWNGLLPVPGHTGEYEWSGFLPGSELPRLYNPSKGFIATANHNILPAGYKHALGYEWAPRFRFWRVEEMLTQKDKFSLSDFQAMQQDVTSIPARRFRDVIRNWKHSLTGSEAELVERIRKWDARLTAQSAEALLYELWSSKMNRLVLPPELGARIDLDMALQLLEKKPDSAALTEGLRLAIADLTRMYGSDPNEWQWGKLHTITFRHPLGVKTFQRGPVARPGDGNTVNSTSGTNFRQTAGASYRMVLDVSNWDNSVMTNVPGESGDPESPHYSSLLDDWANGRYHPMPFSRKAVEEATVERIRLLP